MSTLRAIALISLAGLAAAASANAQSLPARSGSALLGEAFDPERNFAGDLQPNSDDALILTAFASARDSYAPAYSLAIVYRCQQAGEVYRCGYTARMLRVAPGEASLDRSLSLAMAAQSVTTPGDMARTLDGAGLDWLEAAVDACPQGVFAMDSVRVADWNPDIHYALQPVEDREIIMHPAAIRVRMTGSYTTSRYEGWVLANGVPAAMRRLVETLEPCWTPSSSPRPWERPTASP